MNAARPQRKPRRRLFWKNVHIALALLNLTVFLYVAIVVVELESAEARIMSLVLGSSAPDAVEFEYDGQTYEAEVRGYTEATEGDVALVWFWSYNPHDVSYRRQTMFVMPAVVGAVLVAWVVWAVTLRYRGGSVRGP